MNVVPIKADKCELGRDGLSLDLMFAAHDVNGHVLIHSPVWKGWIVLNDHDRLNSTVRHRKTYCNLIAGLSALERASGRRVDDFAVNGL